MPDECAQITHEIDHHRDVPLRDGAVKNATRIRPDDTAFPAGILVGRVSKVSNKDYSMFQEIEVTPAVSFSRLRTVLVLLSSPPPPDPTAGKDKRSEPAFGTRPM